MTVCVEKRAWAPWARHNYGLQNDVIEEICQTGDIPERVGVTDSRLIFSSPRILIVEPEDGITKVTDGFTVKTRYVPTADSPKSPLATICTDGHDRHCGQRRKFRIIGDGTTGLCPSPSHLITVTTYIKGGAFDPGENPGQLGEKRFIISSPYYRRHLQPLQTER